MGEEIFLSPHPLEREFIRLLTDFGFKRVFGSRKRVGILKRFLNALFEGEMRITNVEFRDKEILPEHEGGKKVLYDIYCTTDKGHHFIIEMQQEESENFADRMLFYGCKAVVNQGIKGVEYELYPVYCVILTDFNMEGKKVRLRKDILLMERHSQEIYTENLQFIFLALPEVPKEWDDCDTELKRLLYLIKHMEDLTRESKPYLSGEYDDIFTASSTGLLSQEEAATYAQSYLKEIENRSALRFAEKKGIEKGRLEGAVTKLKEMLIGLRRNGFDNDTIAGFLNESPETIASL
ncbi:MAG: Rpn family recombination-promoting nuclease/putative transposase [Muribaculaceae bacterium]|nr:Rpn family recombination-promoting nuclease/putative transposase [Muribaculaceae bacterium]